MIHLLKLFISPESPYLLTYMLQQSDYSNQLLLQWVLRKPTLHAVKKRGTLVLTNRARINLLVSYGGWLVPPLVVVALLLAGQSTWWLALLLLMPLTSLVALTAVNALVQPIVNKSFKKEIDRANQTLSGISAIRIAVLGSYGKTTMKELLTTILSAEKQVAATPKNKNVLISHARWINTLSGDEDIVIFEYGEAKPGDIAEMAQLSQPDIAIVTGVAPAHMDGYGSLEAIAKDFATIVDYSKQSVYISNDSELLKGYLQPNATYGVDHADKWTISHVKTDITGTSFVMEKGKRRLELSSKLIGQHLVSSIALCVAIADSLGISQEKITSAVAKTKPFEHRMQPYQLNGAWVIDDTYNGNIEGMRAGLQLLKQLQAKKKIYVTPGLVEQGEETQRVHKKLGQLIADAQPDKVYLMNNIVVAYIQEGIVENGFEGELFIVDDPLSFYENLELHVASGDVVLMQNDWPDGYV